MMLLKISLLFLTILVIRTDECYPNFFVEQIFQNSFQFQFTSQQKTSSSLTTVYNHSYWGDAFTQKPNIAYCISSLDFKAQREISFSLEAITHTDKIQFKLGAKGMLWSILNVHIWLFNRNDFFTQQFLFTTSKTSSQGTKSYEMSKKLSLPNQLLLKVTPNSPLIYQTFLTGLKSTSNSLSPIHEININDYLVDDTFRLQVRTQYTNQIHEVNAIVILTVSQAKDFIVYELDFVYTNFRQTYELLNGRFQPVFNILLGLKSLNFKEQTPFSVKQSYDMINSLVHLSTETSYKQIQFIQLSFISFGSPMNNVCSPCKSSYVSIEGCKSKCQQGQHQKIYFDYQGKQSGRTCIKCLNQTNMEYNAQTKFCMCKKQFVMSPYGTKCVEKSLEQVAKNINSDISINTNLKQQCPIKGMIFLNGFCKCQEPLYLQQGKCKECPTDTVYDSVTQKCISNIQAKGCFKQGQQPNKDYTQCVCKSGYERYKQLCIEKCLLNMKRNAQTGSCECLNEYQLVQNKICLKKCGQNQIRSLSGTCGCINGYKLNLSTGKCQKIESIQKNTSESTNTVNKTSTAIVNTPISTNSTNTSPIVQDKIKIALDPSGLVYTSPGIQIDFFITPVISRTSQQVQKLFQISFSDNKLAPPSIFITQNQNNLKQYRVFLYYRNNLPYKSFTVTFKVNDKKLGTDQLNINIDPLKSMKITHARRGQTQYIN